MKRLMLLSLILSLSPLTTFAVDRNDFDRVIDFSATIKTLNDTADPEKLSGRLLLLNGTISNIAFISDKKDDFRIAVDLVSGEWIGLDDVKIYHCTILFEGPEFFPVFPKRKPKNPKPGIILVNDPILVLAKPLQLLESNDGNTLWVLEGLYARRIR